MVNWAGVHIWTDTSKKQQNLWTQSMYGELEEMAALGLAWFDIYCLTVRVQLK